MIIAIVVVPVPTLLQFISGCIQLFPGGLSEVLHKQMVLHNGFTRWFYSEVLHKQSFYTNTKQMSLSSSDFNLGGSNYGPVVAIVTDGNVH